MPKINGPIALKEMDEIQPNARWSDGRVGFVWCRFDAMLDPNRGLRAEITWDDDGDFEGNSGIPSVFFDARLWIETNRPESETSQDLVTWDGISIALSKEEAIALVMGDPQAILGKYPEQIADLKVWAPEDGYKST